LVQNDVPNKIAGRTHITVNCKKLPKVTPVSTYCGEYYDERYAWKNIQSKEAEYNELLTLHEEDNTTSQNIPKSIPKIPCHIMKETRIKTTKPAQ